MYCRYAKKAYAGYKNKLFVGFAHIDEGEDVWCELPHESSQPCACYMVYGPKNYMLALCEQCWIDLVRCFNLVIYTSGSVRTRKEDEPRIIDNSKQTAKDARERKKQWKAQKQVEELERMRDASADKW